MMAATEITDVTPITIPRMVNAERNFLERRVSTATNRFSRISARVIMRRSLRSQSRNRVQFGRLGGRIDAEKQADDGTEHDAQDRYPSLDSRRKRSQAANCQRAQKADKDANQPSHDALHDALGQELHQDIPLRGAHGAADADLL